MIGRKRKMKTITPQTVRAALARSTAAVRIAHDDASSGKLTRRRLRRIAPCEQTEAPKTIRAPRMNRIMMHSHGCTSDQLKVVRNCSATSIPAMLPSAPPSRTG